VTITALMKQTRRGVRRSDTHLGRNEEEERACHEANLCQDARSKDRVDMDKDEEKPILKTAIQNRLRIGASRHG
jgi:hypothetical protein